MSEQKTWWLTNFPIEHAPAKNYSFFQSGAQRRTKVSFGKTMIQAMELQKGTCQNEATLKNFQVSLMQIERNY